MELSPYMWTSLISQRFEGVLCRSLELFLQPPPFQHSALQILVLQMCFLELWWLPSAHFGLIWVLCSALCPGNCLQAANWTIVGLISFLSLPSGITVLLCLFSSCFMYLSGFPAVYGGSTTPIAVNPSWSEADVGISILKSSLGYSTV